MPRIDPVTEEDASPKVKVIFDLIKKKVGRIPNIFLNMGNAPSVLEGYVGLSDAANHTSLSPLLREKIALTVGEANKCDYCLSAHSELGKKAGLNDEEILAARKASAPIAKDQAILQFAKKMVDKKGNVSDEDIKELKNSNVTQEEMLEIVLVVTLNIFTNYFNHLTDPKIDFPKVAKSS